MALRPTLFELARFGWDQARDQLEKLKLKLKIIAYNNKKSNYYTYLGELVYRFTEANETNPLEDPNIQNVLQEIRIIHGEVEKGDEELNRLRDLSRRKRETMAGRKEEILNELKKPFGFKPGDDAPLGKGKSPERREDVSPEEKKGEDGESGKTE